MSKHSSTEEKLKVAKRLQQDIKAKQQMLWQHAKTKDTSVSSAPLKGTNASNQFR